MIQIYGPCNRRSLFSIDNSEPKEVHGKSHPSSAKNLGDAIIEYCRVFEIEMEPCNLHDGRYFIVTTPGHRFEGAIYDPHVFRNSTEICPKQDLEFTLIDGDILDLGGPLAC